MRSRKLYLALAVIALLVLGMTTALADTVRFGTVSGGSTVNLRASVSTRSEKLGVYRKNTWLKILNESGDWYRVEGPDGKRGWMMKKYVYIASGAKGTVGIVDKAGYLNLRKTPSQSGKILGQYDDGTPCILLSENDGWCHVSVDGTIGYFQSSFISKQYITYSPDVGTVVTKNGGSLRLRSGPGTGYSTVRSYRNYTLVMILQKGDGWWKVSVNGKTGYMDADYLKDGIVRKNGTTTPSTDSSSSSSSSSSSNLTGKGYAVVKNPGSNQRLYLRASASKNSESLGKYANGKKVTVLAPGKEWCRVQVDGKVGYMMTRYLKLQDLPATPTVMVVHPKRSFVYLRGAPVQSTGNVLTKVSHGATVTVLAPGPTWTHVSYKGYTGYMMTRYLDD